MSSEIKLDQHNNEVFQKYYDELALVFLEYDKGRTEFKQIFQDKKLRYLEIGSGTGLFCTDLIKEGYQIDGLEPNNAFADKFMEKSSQFKSKVIVKSVSDYDFKDCPYNVILSHSGPFLFTKVDDELFLEGLPIKHSAEENKNIIRSILKHIKQVNGMLAINIQENKTNIKLSDGTIYTLKVVDPGYDCAKYTVIKEYAFISKKEPERYSKFACRFDIFESLVKEIGDLSISEHAYWVIVKRS
jgi:SAM-dependent methyltransferase